MEDGPGEPAAPREAIARLEEQIEQLHAKLESCQKFSAASRFAMALGGVLLAGLLFGIIPFDPLPLIGPMPAALRGAPPPCPHQTPPQPTPPHIHPPHPP